MTKMINALFGGQSESLTYVGYGTCPECGDDCAEIWCDETTGKRYIRCPYFMCDGWGKLRELVVEVDDGCDLV